MHVSKDLLTVKFFLSNHKKNAKEKAQRFKLHMYLQ